MDASCGPSNALSQLSKHSQRDTSLQNDTIQRHNAMNAPQAFRNGPGVDANLNRDFEQFNRNLFEVEQFGFQGPQMNQPQRMLPAPLQNVQSSQTGWIQDFNGLSIQNPGPQKADWHRQFMNMQQQPQVATQHANAQFQQAPQFQQPMHFQQHQFQLAQHFQPQQGYQQPAQLPKQVNEHTMEVDPQAFADHFDQIEQELAAEEKNAYDNEHEKEQFAEAARQVKNSMITEKNLKSEETSSKFEQSNFLKLMALISDRTVELSQEGDKLVEKSSGEDIRNHLSDPLMHEKIDYHEPVHETHELRQNAPEPVITNESQQIRSHLPDPLAHIKDGALSGNLSSLQAAQIISGGQVKENQWLENDSWEPRTIHGKQRGGLLDTDWQEVYDDYRHDDDYH